MSLLLNVYREDGVASGRLVVHVGAGGRAVESAVLEARHRLVLRPDRPRRHPDLEHKSFT